MPEVRNFRGAQPGERDDGHPYLEVAFDEAPEVDDAPGTWVEIDRQDLDPVDTDPANPLARNLTTEEATLEVGWYRLRFIDADGDEDRTLPVRYPPTETWVPTVDDVAALLPARTKDSNGRYVGTFNDDTRPTGDQVQALIVVAVRDVSARVGTAIVDEYGDEAKHCAALQAATLVEAGFFPDQLENDRSPYRQHQAMFLSSMEALTADARRPSALRLV